MRLPTTITAIFAFASAAIAAPTTLGTRGDEICTPASYTISDYTLTTSPTSGTVDFTFTSAFPGTVDDPVQSGAHCGASGASVPNSNECQVDKRRLLFDLRAPQEQAYYQITHTWSCNGSTWMSGNAVRINPLNCRTEGDKRICTGGPQTFVPESVRKICSTPTCPGA